MYVIMSFVRADRVPKLYNYNIAIGAKALIVDLIGSNYRAAQLRCIENRDT